MEFLSIKGVELKADVDNRVIEGYAATFGNVDSYRDTIIKGAFATSIAEKFTPYEAGRGRVKTLYQHDWDRPLGVPEVLQEDEEGLFFRSKVSPTSYGKDALMLINDGVIDRVSIGFNTVRSEWKENEGDDAIPYVRVLMELDLWEVSPVTFAADDHTSLDAVKRAEWLRRELKEGRVLSSKNVDKLENAIALLSEVLEAARPKEDEEKTAAGPDNVDNWNALEEMLAELKSDAANLQR